MSAGAVAQQSVIDATASILTMIPWHSAFWASDPQWSNPGDGNAVSSWRNAGTNGTAALQATGANQPIYRSNVAQLGSKPAIEFDGNTHYLSAAFTLTQAFTQVSVVRSLDASQNNLDYITYGGSGQCLLAAATSTTLHYNAGTPLATNTVMVSSPMLVVILWNGASSQVLVNGSDVTNGNPGTNGYASGFDIGNRASLNRGGNFQHAFHGLIGRALTAQEQINLTAWSRAYYKTPIVTDSFNRADNSSSLGTADTGQTWTALSGTWGISSNTAFVNPPLNGAWKLAVVDVGLTDQMSTATFGTVATSDMGTVGRASDSSNFYLALRTGTELRLYKVVSGTATQLGSSVTGITWVTGDTISLRTAGTTVQAYRNGASLISVTDASLSGTKSGVYIFAGSGTPTFDSFTLSPA